MEATDLAVRSVAIGLSAWALKKWWDHDVRIAILARFLAMGLMAIAAGGLAIQMAFTAGMARQYKADTAASSIEWEARRGAIAELDIRNQDKSFPSTKQLGVLLGRPSIQLHDTALLSGTSVLFLLWLWIVLTFVANIPPLGAQPKAKGDAHEDAD